MWPPGGGGRKTWGDHLKTTLYFYNYKLPFSKPQAAKPGNDHLFILVYSTKYAINQEKSGGVRPVGGHVLAGCPKAGAGVVLRDQSLSQRRSAGEGWEGLFFFGPVTLSATYSLFAKFEKIVSPLYPLKGGGVVPPQTNHMFLTAISPARTHGFWRKTLGLAMCRLD